MFQAVKEKVNFLSEKKKIEKSLVIEIAMKKEVLKDLKKVKNRKELNNFYDQTEYRFEK